MRKVMLVTGRLAERSVQRYSKLPDLAIETEVKTVPVSVAQFMSSELLVEELKGIDPKGYSMILTPGLVRCDLRSVEVQIGIPVFKGPKYAADLPVVLRELGKIELSKDKPACELLEGEIRASIERELEKVEADALRSFREPQNFFIGRGKCRIAAGKHFPQRLMAEIEDAPLLANAELREKAKRYLESGAEILDLGMVAGRDMSGEVSRIISTLRENFDVPISIDTSNENEIRKAIEMNIDLILSIDGSTIESFPGLEIPAVLVPVDSKRGYYPSRTSEKIEYLLKLAERAGELGYERIIVDPILQPIGRGFVESLVSFYELRDRAPQLPILMGLGNVIELCDADSVGMTALLAGAASELGASFLLTVEASDKTRGNVAELRRARDMMVLAKSRECVPKDLGINLLLLKEKRRYSDEYDESIEQGLEVIEAKAPREFKLGAEKIFKIFANRSELIAVLYMRGKPELVIKGKTAEGICEEVAQRGLVEEVRHAAYLGRELQKAEIALKLGKGYLQDKELF